MLDISRLYVSTSIALNFVSRALSQCVRQLNLGCLERRLVMHVTKPPHLLVVEHPPISCQRICKALLSFSSQFQLGKIEAWLSISSIRGKTTSMLVKNGAIGRGPTAALLFLISRRYGSANSLSKADRASWFEVR